MLLIIETPDEKVLKAILELIRPFNVTFKEVKSSNTASLKKPEETPQPPKATRKLGIMPGLVAYMAPDFNAPLEDFATLLDHLSDKSVENGLTPEILDEILHES